MTQPHPSASEPEHPPTPAVDRARFFSIFTAVLLPMFLAAVDQTLLATATPAIGQEFNNMGAISWLAVGYLLASVVTVPLYGRLADHLGRRRMLGVALGIFALGSAACAAAPGMATLIAARILQGTGGAGLMSLSQALIGEVLAPRQRARYQAYFAIVFVSASLMGPVLGGLVVQHAHWRWLFVVNLPLCALAAWRLARLTGTATVRTPHAPIDWTGGALFAAAASLTLWQLSGDGAAQALSSSGTTAASVLALALWATLWWVERRVAEPYVPLDLLRLPAMRQAALTTLAFASTMFSLVFYLPAYAHLIFGSSAAEGGLRLLPLTGGIILGSGMAGRIMLYTGRTRELPMFGLALASASLMAMGGLAPSPGLVLALSASIGIGLGMVMSVMQIVSQLAAGPARLGAAAAVVSLTRNLGAALGAAGFGAIAMGGFAPRSHAQGAAIAEVASSHGFHMAFVTAAVVSALGAWAASGLPRERLPKDGAPPSEVAEVA
jgi:MFS family permease